MNSSFCNRRNFLKGAVSVVGSLAVFLLLGTAAVRGGENLVSDPSFEQPKAKDRFGGVFAKWGGWIYEGQCEFRVSDLAHTGKHSLLMVASNAPKIRAWPHELFLAPGRYRVTAYLRGLDIGAGPYGQTTEFIFAGKYMPLRKGGTFGWTRLSFVGEIKENKKQSNPGFGLLAPGYLWVDDVAVEKVDNEVALTPQPVFGTEEKAIEPPGELGDHAARCPECGYRNNLGWNRCYACGTGLTAKKAAGGGPPVKSITSFEDRNPFSGGTVVREHATDGNKSLRIDRDYVSMDSAQNWSGYDYLKADVFTTADRPVELNVEVRDRQTRDYWTRVNYTTVIPPGKSTLIMPTALYVGEKSRPGRALQLDAITRLVFAIGDKPPAPLFIDYIRLERDTETAKVQFNGLWAFDVGPAGSPVMEGFTPLDMSRRYTKGRGYGWKDAHFWRAFDALQPDPLYRDFICVEKGGLALDVPNGKYHVFVNMDSPSGYWGEYQVYRRRALILEGSRYVDKMDLESFKKKYFRFWEQDDLPGENTFDKYQIPYFREKLHEVDVRDGQLNIDFEGENWACCVSAIVVYPDSKADEGKRFLDFVQQRRRFHFDNAFKRVLHRPANETPKPAEDEKSRGFVAFSRDWMRDVYSNDVPAPAERVKELNGSAFAGEYEPVTVSLWPQQDLGRVSLTVTDLQGSGEASIPSGAINVGYVQHRITRVTGEGSVYTLSPRLIIPRASANVPAGVTRTFWLTVKVPADTAAGVYRGTVRLKTEKGGELSLPLRFTVRKGTLDAVDVPAGPWGHTIDLPWHEEETAAWNRDMATRSLKKLREYGFTTASGLPVLTYNGFKDGVPQIDFTHGDAQMKRFKENGFHMPVVTYCPFHGMNTYFRDEDAMRAAGFTDYSRFIQAMFGTIHAHGEKAGWLPVYWNIGDEPVGDDVNRSAENAEAYRKAFPKGPPLFTAASSFQGKNKNDPHFRLSRALSVADWNGHDEDSVKLLHAAGGDWAFYNGGNRWTYGVYMYKAAKQHGMKFRLSWHWNAVAGDPYYALDCREDDYAWCNCSPEGELIPAVQFERLREGLGDYRRMLTLARLAREQKGTLAAHAAEKLLADILGSFRLGDRELKGEASFVRLRARLDDAIEKLR
ncbi:MAG TPA: glycoside hydrolase domain-containing protein [Gemmataceae bacterium]|nr:glycoside hydrolase domain-containing protein [Gemmataceae bacterium]